MALTFKTFSGKRLRLGALTALKHRLCFPNGELIQYYKNMSETDNSYFLQGKIILALRDDNPVGSCYVYSGELQLYVTPKLRRQHIGTALYRKAQQLLKMKEFVTFSGDKVAKRFFEKVKE